MDADKFLEYLEKSEETISAYYIVRIKVKYIDEDDYRFINEILAYDGDYDLWIWEDDWHHCIEDAKVVGYIPIDEVRTFRPLPIMYGVKADTIIYDEWVGENFGDHWRGRR